MIGWGRACPLVERGKPLSGHDSWPPLATPASLSSPTFPLPLFPSHHNPLVGGCFRHFPPTERKRSPKQRVPHPSRRSASHHLPAMNSKLGLTPAPLILFNFLLLHRLHSNSKIKKSFQISTHSIFLITKLLFPLTLLSRVKVK